MLSLLLTTVLSLPLENPEGWKQVGFAGIDENRVTYSAKGLEIAVNESSSPLLYKLPQTMDVNEIFVRGELTGFPKIPAKAAEGIDDGDDFALRLGLVEPGPHTLNWFKRLFAPKWMTELFDLAPDKGLEKVHTFLISQNLDQGFERTHPSSKLIEETVALKIRQAGPFRFKFRIQWPIKTCAVWLNADGDDSSSRYSITLKSIQLVSR